MKRILLLILALSLALSACASQEEPEPMEPQVTQMQAICELSVMDCYFHNVAKFSQDDAEKFLWWTKDKHFWVEYSGIVTYGVDISQVAFEISGSEITVSLPPVKVLNCEVDSASLTEDSFVVAKGSADIDAEDQVNAITAAQEKMLAQASSDQLLLTQAKQRVMTLLEEYISTFSTAAGTEYKIVWNLLEPAAAPDSSGE